MHHAETTKAMVQPWFYGTKVVSAGGNVEGTTSKSYGYRHGRVARDYLHVNKLATLTVNSVTNILVQEPLGSSTDPGILS